MTLGNHYYEFDEPVRWFKAVGVSPSNAWWGANRLDDIFHEPTTLNPGDQVHALHGGVWVVRADGTVEVGAFRLPKPRFEKNHGGTISEQSLVAMMAKCGRCHEIDKPDYRINYPAVWDEVRARKLPEKLGCVDQDRLSHPANISPLLRKLLDASSEVGLGGSLSKAGAKWYRIDIGQGSEPDVSECSIRIDLANGKRLSVSASPTRREVWVRDYANEGGFADAVKAADSFAGGLTPEFRNSMVTIFPEDEVGNVMKALASYVEHGHVPSPGAPRP